MNYTWFFFLPLDKIKVSLPPEISRDFDSRHPPLADELERRPCTHDPAFPSQRITKGEDNRRGGKQHPMLIQAQIRARALKAVCISSSIASLGRRRDDNGQVSKANILHIYLP